jgi:thioredoxin reductase (NADPH)
MSHYQTDVVIIGAGPVGLFGIFQCGMLGLNVHVFDGLPHAGGQCSALYPEKPIYDIPAYPSILGQELVDNLMQQIEPFKPSFHFKSKITHIESFLGEDYQWTVKSDQGISVDCKAILIAAGVGAFGPNRPPLADIEQFENTSIHYFVRSKDLYKGKNVVIAGGGDSAVDWTLALQPIVKKLTVVHRRNNFRAAPKSEEMLKVLAQKGLIELVVPYQLEGVKGKGNMLNTIIVQNFDDKSIKEIEADYLLPFFGLSTNLGPISEWGLGIHKNAIEVNQGTSQTNKESIYAIGDVATYPHKLKLILTGFSEAAQAAHSIYKEIYGIIPHFEHSTTKGIPLK